MPSKPPSRSTNPLSHKRLNLGGGDDDDDDDPNDTEEVKNTLPTRTTITPGGVGVGGSGSNAGGTSFKLQKTAKKRVNPFKNAAAAATKPRIASSSSTSSTEASPVFVSGLKLKSKSIATQTGGGSRSIATGTGAGTGISHERKPLREPATAELEEKEKEKRGDDDEELDYLSMPLTSLPSANTSTPETYTQRRQRLAREAEARARVPSKIELAEEERRRREEGLKRSLLEDKNSKGYRMMKAMGWREEGGLGKVRMGEGDVVDAGPGGGDGGREGRDAQDDEDGDDDNDDEPSRAGLGLGHGHQHPPPPSPPPPPSSFREPILEPIALTIKEDRGGIGHLSSEQRKFRERLQREGVINHPSSQQKQQTEQESAESYRTRIRLEREEKRAEAQFYAAQNILEGFDRGENAESSTTPPPKRHHSPLLVGGSRFSFSSGPNEDKSALPRTIPLKSIPLLYRSLIKHREEKDRAKRARYDFMESLSSATHSSTKPFIFPGYERDLEEKAMFGVTSYAADGVEDGEEEDTELEEFNQLPFVERLEMIVKELREKWKYCFWCKYRYSNQEEMDESCPGLEEESHG